MPCERCSAQFGVLKRRRVCGECGRHFCGGCLGNGQHGQQQKAAARAVVCPACRVLVSKPLSRVRLDSLRVRDLQCFLHEHRVSTAGCVEKEDLVALVLTHDFAPRPPPPSELSQTISQIRGFTQTLLHQAFDIGQPPDKAGGRPKRGQNAQNRTPTPTSPPTPTRATNPIPPFGASAPSPPPTPAAQVPTPSAPVPVPTPPADPGDPTTSGATPSAGRRRLEETDDCIEIEDDPDDEDDPDWEIVSPSPNTNRDPEVVLLEEPTTSEPPPAPPPPPDSPALPRIRLGDLKDLSDVENLKAKQLKELLILNRVDFKGCCERKELLERAKRLWRENAKSREDLEAAETSEELCKICMDAPMECVMLECGHIATCLGCGKRLNECPICREYVVRVVRFFRS